MRITGASWVIGFDDIQLLIANKTQEFYLRKTFNWSSPFNSEFDIANILSDDSATIWLNSHRIDADNTPHPDQYWNRRGKSARGSWLRNGTNVVAAKVSNTNGQSKFDADFSLLSRMRAWDIVLTLFTRLFLIKFLLLFEIFSPDCLLPKHFEFSLLKSPVEGIA